jgi:hypothetical protein
MKILHYQSKHFDEWNWGRWRVQFFTVEMWRWGLWRLHRDRYATTWACPFFSVKRSH